MLDFENNTEQIGQTTQGQVTEVASPAGESSCPVPEQQATVVGHDAGLEDVIETSLRYGWLGIGQCGTRLAKCFYDLGYRKVIALNTCVEELDDLQIPTEQKLLVPIDGGGTGADMDVAAKAVGQHREEILNQIRSIFGTGIDRIMVCFGAGGGTGGGSAAELMELARMYTRHIGLKNPAMSVGAIVTLPAADRVGSPQVVNNTRSIMAKVSKMAAVDQVSPLVVVDNDKVRTLYPNLTARSFWPSINVTVTTLLDTFNRLSATPTPYLSLAPEDYRSIAECKGCMVVGVAKVTKFDDPLAISVAVKRSIERSATIAGLDWSKAKAVGCIAVARRKLLESSSGLRENIQYVFDSVSEMTGNAKVHGGIYEDGRDGLRIYTIIAGLDVPAQRIGQLDSDSYFRPDIVDLNALGFSQRRQCILHLADQYLKERAADFGRPYKRLGPVAETMLVHYAWPGGIAELAAAMKRADELTVGGTVEADALAFEIIFAGPSIYPKDIRPALARTMQRLIVKALTLTKGDQDRAAKILGIDVEQLGQLAQLLKIHTVWKKPAE